MPQSLLQMHECPVEAACNYGNRTDQLMALQQQALDTLRTTGSNLDQGTACLGVLSGPLRDVNAAFLAAMCSDGYGGRLCAGEESPPMGMVICCRYACIMQAPCKLALNVRLHLSC